MTGPSRTHRPGRSRARARSSACRGPRTRGTGAPARPGVVGLDEAGVAAHAGEVGARAEGLLPCAGEHDHAHVGISLGIGRGLTQTSDHVPRHGVAPLGPVDRHPSDVVAHLVQQCRVRHRSARYRSTAMRFTLAAVGLGFVLALVLGGRPRFLSGRSLRLWSLLPLGLALQLAAIEEHGHTWPFVLLLLSYACLVAFAITNLS